VQRLEVPEPNQIANISMSDGATIVLRRYGVSDGPRLVLSHGNGLAIDAYLPFWQLLCDRYDLIVFDVRNHGRNPHHTFEAHNWDRIGQDMDEIQDQISARFGGKPMIGVFHSLSAVAAVRQVLAGGTRWSRLILFDPPFYPPAGHPLLAVQQEHLDRMARLARRRPEHYENIEDFSSLLSSRPQFSRWRPGAHDLFARATLRQNPSSSRWDLACPRDYEAQIFETNRDGTVWPALAGGLDVPSKIIGADPLLSDRDGPSQVCSALAQELGIDYESVPATTHMLQLEAPETCVAALERGLHL